MRSFLLVSVISISLPACYSDGSAQLPVGSAQARITQVPPMVGCVSITVSANRTVTDNFNVTPGQPATLTLDNLPVGSDSFTAAAYASGCGAIGGAQPTWASAWPFVTPIAAGVVTSLTLTLEPSGGANIGINFDGDGGTTIDGGRPVDGGAPADLAPSHIDGGSVPDLARPFDLAQPKD